MRAFLSKYGEKKNEGLDFQNWVFNYPFNQITQEKKVGYLRRRLASFQESN